MHKTFAGFKSLKTVTFGGLTYNANQVESAYEDQYSNGRTKYVLQFKSGERLEYPEQPVSVPCSLEESTYAVDGNGERINREHYHRRYNRRAKRTVAD